MTQASVATDHFAKGDFRVGGVIGRSASVLVRHFPAYFIVSLVAWLPILLLTSPEAARAFSLLLGRTAWPVVVFVVQFVLGMLGQAVILHAAFADIRRQPVRLTLSFKVGLRRFLPVIGLALVVGFLLLLGLVLLIIPGLILYTMWFVAVAPCVVERLGPWRSLRRSQELTEGHRFKVLGLALLLIVVSLGGLLIETVLVAIAGPTAGLIGGAVWAVFSATLASVVTAVTYHDLRVAKEGIDIEEIATVFD